MRRLLWCGPHPPSIPGFTAVNAGRPEVVVVDIAAGESLRPHIGTNVPVVAYGTIKQITPAPSGVSYAIMKPAPADVLAGALRRLFAPPQYRDIVEATMEEKGLTPREKEACMMALRGFTDKEMSDATNGPSTKTWKIHLGSVYKKFNVRGRAELFAAIFPV